MKPRILIAGIVIVIIIAVSAMLLMRPPREIHPEKTVVAKKVLSKGMGGLTLKMLNANNKQVFIKAKAFKSANTRSGICVGPLVTNNMKELSPGSYDIQLDTVPQKMHKGVNILDGKETIENIGCITGLLNVKVTNTKKKEAFYPVRIYYSKTKYVVASTAARRPVELLSGAYDVEIGTKPIQTKGGIKVNPGEETVVEIIDESAAAAAAPPAKGS
ncbi:MAG: hypothetical protein JXB40_05245 [Candidatus Omnitrophica bacterium]|nr:hypothetical protein [Candidatus Omnitrophota bacterium]